MWGSGTGWQDEGQLYMGTGYGAAVRWGCIRGCGIRRLHAERRYTFWQLCTGPDLGLRYGGAACRAAVHGGCMRGGIA